MDHTILQEFWKMLHFYSSGGYQNKRGRISTKSNILNYFLNLILLLSVGSTLFSVFLFPVDLCSVDKCMYILNCPLFTSRFLYNPCRDGATVWNLHVPTRKYIIFLNIPIFKFANCQKARTQSALSKNIQCFLLIPE